MAASVELGWDNSRLRAGAAEAENRVRRAAGAMESALRKIDVGSLVGGFVLGAGLSAGISQLTQLGKRGFEFNQSMKDSEVAIANVIRKFQGLSGEAAKREASKAMEAIVAMEPRSAATLQGLTEGFLATFAASQSAGLSIEQNVDLVGRLANAVANANLPAEQLVQELQSIVSGNITSDSALARLLLIKNADIERAKQAGNLYEFLVKRVGALGEAGDTAGVAFSTLSSALDKAAGNLTAGLFDDVVDGAKALSVILEENVQLTKDLGGLFSRLGDAGVFSLDILGASLDALSGRAEFGNSLFNRQIGRTAQKELAKKNSSAATEVDKGSAVDAKAQAAQQQQDYALAAAQYELEILQLQAAGQEKKAAALERAKKIAEDALRIERETGLSQAAALAMAKEKAALEEKIEKNAGKEGRIRGFSREDRGDAVDARARAAQRSQEARDRAQSGRDASFGGLNEFNGRQGRRMNEDPAFLRGFTGLKELEANQPGRTGARSLLPGADKVSQAPAANAPEKPPDQASNPTAQQLIQLVTDILQTVKGA